MAYYRLVLDFSHDEQGDDFDELFDALAEAIVLVLDPPHGEDEPCARDWYASGGDVTEEYDAYEQHLKEEIVDSWKSQLSNATVDDFIQTTVFKDHPRGADGLDDIDG